MTALDATPWPAVPSAALLLVPLGSTEQHGPHLPFTVDAEVAVAVTRAAGERLGAVLAPPLLFGSSGEHQEFPGTLSIGQDALQAVLVELARSARSWASRLVFVNGHGGNAPVLARVVPRLRAEGHDLGWVPCGVPGGDAHAGLVETSLMLHLAPERVGSFAEVAGSAQAIEELMPALREGRLRSVAPSGVLGVPAGATAAHGEALLAAIVEDVVARIRRDRVDPSGCLAGERGEG